MECKRAWKSGSTVHIIAKNNDNNTFHCFVCESTVNYHYRTILVIISRTTCRYWYYCLLSIITDYIAFYSPYLFTYSGLSVCFKIKLNWIGYCYVFHWKRMDWYSESIRLLHLGHIARTCLWKKACTVCKPQNLRNAITDKINGMLLISDNEKS